MKAFQATNPIISSPRSIAPDTWVNGKVARLAPFGAFVTVTAEGKSADGAWAKWAVLMGGLMEEV